MKIAGSASSSLGPLLLVLLLLLPASESVSERYRSVQAGGTFSCARTKSGYALGCWGDNRHGQLDVPEAYADPTKTNDDGILFWRFSLGYDHGCLHHDTFSEGKIACWGNEAGYRGMETLESRVEEAEDRWTIEDIVTGKGLTCVLLRFKSGKSATECFGDAAAVENNSSSSPLPTTEQDMFNAAVPTGGAHFCAQTLVVVDNTTTLPLETAHQCVHCPPKEEEEDLDACSTPFSCKLSAGYLMEWVVTGLRHACALYRCGGANTTQKVECIGGNEFGQSSVPSDLGPIERDGGMAAGDYFTCAVRDRGVYKGDEHVVCWGKNESGVLEVPELVKGLMEDVDGMRDRRSIKLSAGSDHVCASNSEYGVGVCWGNNDYGQVSPTPDFLKTSASSAETWMPHKLAWLIMLGLSFAASL